MGARNVVEWYQGDRSYLGSPCVKWPSGKEVLDKFGGNVTLWSKGLSEKPANVKKVDLVSRFTALHEIIKHLQRTCPQNLRENLSQFAKDVDRTRGKCSMSAWWDRIRINASCHAQAQKYLLDFPCWIQNKTLTEEQFIEFREQALQIQILAKGGIDKLGEAHTMDAARGGRQKFAASDMLENLKFKVKKLQATTTGSRARLHAIAHSNISGIFN